jgi:glycosyltransferase involved in cell wall biosynthesis
VAISGRPEPRRRVLALARSYPSSVLPTLGLWTERPLREVARTCDLRVVSPVPYCPPLPGWPRLRQYTRFREIDRLESRNGFPVYHPRFVVGPGQSLHALEAGAYELGVRRLVDGIRREFPFDLIHAHFIYPDGVVAHRLARRYGVPFVVTDQAPWWPWLEQRGVRRAAIPAARAAACLTVVSEYVAETVRHYLGDDEKILVIPNGVFGDDFSLPQPWETRDPDQILFVGLINYNKGIDVLLEAMRRVAAARPRSRLVLAGGSFYRNTRLQEEELRRRAADMAFGETVQFLGPLPPEEISRLMRTSAVLVLPSRAETFGAVLVEALACGTPVVASRSGGPEDIVTSAVGRLVPTGDPPALGDALIDVLSRPENFPQRRLREYALRRFDWRQIAGSYVKVYRAALENRPPVLGGLPDPSAILEVAQ